MYLTNRNGRTKQMEHRLDKAERILRKDWTRKQLENYIFSSVSQFNCTDKERKEYDRKFRGWKKERLVQELKDVIDVDLIPSSNHTLDHNGR